MNTKNFNKWIAALRSGEFEQASGSLIDDLTDEDGNAFDEWGQPITDPHDEDTFPAIGFCCLGVGAQICDPTGDWGEDALAPRSFIDWLGIPVKPSVEGGHPPTANDHFDIAGPRTTASEMNDGGKSFKQIARWLEKNKDRLVATY